MAPTREYTAHPAVGLGPAGKRSATLFGESRPPFRWMRLPSSRQEEHASRFYRTLLSKIATYPMLDVQVTFADEGVARTVASSTGLSVDGRTVKGHGPAPTAVVRLADERWEELTLTSGSRPLLAADTGKSGVKLWLDAQHAASLKDALAPAVVTELAGASPQRTRRAALLIAMSWGFLAAVILAGVLIYRLAESVTPTVLAIVIGIVLAAPLIWPLQEVGKAIQRRYYDNVG